MPIYETGHARNIERFQQMISFVTSWGTSYAPSNTAIWAANLTSKATAATSSMTSVTGGLTDYKAAVNDRETTFDGLRQLTTRVVNYSKSTGTDKNKIDDLMTIKRKIDGTRATTVKDDPSTPEDESSTMVSASQQSFTQLVEHFSGLLALLAVDPLYTPGETELTVAGLTVKRDGMMDANQVVIDKATAVSNNRTSRNNALYAEGTGLVDLAALVKAYTKAAFATTSSQYNQIKGLKFTRPRG
jgi:hypothetical protein